VERRTARPNRTVYLEWIVSLLVADGLARQGSSKVLNTSGVVSEWSLLDYKQRSDFNEQILGNGHPLETGLSPNLTTFHWDFTIQGLAYRATLSTDYLAICVLLGHTLLAVAHTIWLLCKRQSSGCWDTITELLTLAQNSSPAHKKLKNTSAGIKCLGTFSKVAKVRVVRNPASDNEELTNPSPTHVELIFSEGNSMEQDCPHPESESEASHISSPVTWPGVGKKARVSALGVGGSPNSVSSSRAMLLRPLRGKGHRSKQSVCTSALEMNLDILDEVRPDKLYG